MSTTLREIVDGAKNLTNEYKAEELSKETPMGFLNRVFHDYYGRPAYLDEDGYIMISLFGGEADDVISILSGEGEVDNVHDEERGERREETLTTSYT